jgi:hypothetical protein
MQSGIFAILSSTSFFNIVSFDFLGSFRSPAPAVARIWSAAKRPFPVDETGWIRLYIVVLSA